jgi:hypothetical protein
VIASSGVDLLAVLAVILAHQLITHHALTAAARGHAFDIAF